MRHIISVMCKLNKSIILLYVAILFITGCGRSKPYIRPYEYSANQEAILQYQRAQDYENTRQYDLAIVEYRHYIDYYGDIYRGDEAQFRLAQCYQYLNQYPEAISNYWRLLKKYKHSQYVSETLYHIGQCHEAKKEYNKAVKTYIKVIKNHYRTPWAKESEKNIYQILDSEQFAKSKWAKKCRRNVIKITKKMERK